MALVKASIIYTVTNKQELQEVQVMFNPEQYTLSKEVNYAQSAIPGLSAPIFQFVNGNSQTLEMELLLDTVEKHKAANRVLNQAGDDVREFTKKIANLMEIDPTTHAPPVLLFVWGSLSFQCVLTRVNQQFIMFSPDGTPLRAKLQVTFSEFRNVDLETKEIKRETADYSKAYQVGQGESLSTISWREYGDPRLWRVIALSNNIKDPRDLQVGQPLYVPPLPYRDPETGRIYQKS